MKKLLPLLSVLFLIYWGCEDEREPPTEVTLWGEIYSVEDTERLDFHRNELTGPIPSEIWNLTNLTYLDLSENQFTGSIPSKIGNLTNLTVLDLGQNQLTGSIPSKIG
ncbi:MAG: hypothetical protein HOJ64_02820, partial [Euryarchaeota archaeon]|nr:hypothetical protein [Euryarchaeota archaeon]